MTASGDHVASFDAEQVEDIDENIKLFAAIGTKINSRRWEKKHESSVVDRDKIKLKTVVLLGNRDEEVQMTQSFGFIVAKSISVG